MELHRHRIMERPERKYTYGKGTNHKPISKIKLGFSLSLAVVSLSLSLSLPLGRRLSLSSIGWLWTSIYNTSTYITYNSHAKAQSINKLCDKIKCNDQNSKGSSSW